MFNGSLFNLHSEMDRILGLCFVLNFLLFYVLEQADKVCTEVEGYRKKLARAEAIFENYETVKKLEGTRSMHKTGTLGLVGKQIDSINFYNEKIKDLSLKLKTKQKITLTEKQVAAAFIIFNSRSVAAAAAQVVHSQIGDTWTTMEAPEPCQVVYKNLALRNP